MTVFLLIFKSEYNVLIKINLSLMRVEFMTVHEAMGSFVNGF